MEEAERVVSVKRNFQDKPLRDEVMKRVTVETFGESYEPPVTL